MPAARASWRLTRLLARHGELATLSPASLDALNAALPEFWSHGNPVDVLGDASPERYKTATEIVLKDETVDGTLIILTPQAMTDSTSSAGAIAMLAAGSSRPILAAWMGGTTVEEGNACLNKAGIPTYQNPGQAVRAFMHLVSYGRNRQILYETPRELPVSFSLDRQNIRDRFAATLSGGETLISEPICKSLLAAYGIPTTKTLVAAAADDAVRVARDIGYPVVMKIVSPNVSHKTDVGGVRLNLKTDDEVRSAFREITASVARAVVGAQIDGVAVQEMIHEPSAVELILGEKRTRLSAPCCSLAWEASRLSC